MWKRIAALAFAIPTATTAQGVPPGRWDVTSTAVDLAIPGVPGFLVRMMTGRSKTEHKCVAPEQAAAGVAALLAPDPKAKCHVDSLEVDNGRYAQTISCPQKQGAPLKVVRTGHYSAAGFAGRAQLAGTTPKGPIAITLDQKATHLTGACRG